MFFFVFEALCLECAGNVVLGRENGFKKIEIILNKKGNLEISHMFGTADRLVEPK